jgi:hypothetical protein
MGISNFPIFLSTLSAVKIHFLNYSFDLCLGTIKKAKLKGKLNIIVNISTLLSKLSRYNERQTDQLLLLRYYESVSDK